MFGISGKLIGFIVVVAVVGGAVGGAVSSGMLLFFSQRQTASILTVSSPTPSPSSEVLPPFEFVSTPLPSPSPSPSPSPKKSKAPVVPSPTPRISLVPSPSPSPSPAAASGFVVTSVFPSTVDNASGNFVNIEGNGFVSTANVMVGPSFLSVFSGSARSLTVRVPADFPPGTHDITVINPDGKQASLKNGLTVTGVVASPSPSPTPSPSDTIAPVITNIRSSDPSSESITILWDTNESALGKLEYGPSGGVVITTGWTTGYSNVQSVTVTNLTPNTTYAYRVHSKDSAGNQSFAPPDGNLYFITYAQ
ncbi:MAG: fibronectin type III domain-containing protein [Parcubacteria group bacterium]|nr:fibronectin type III domain-containing protein [Parcubacteria group bacterium]